MKLYFEVLDDALLSPVDIFRVFSTGKQPILKHRHGGAVAHRKWKKHRASGRR